jgi:uncharacterized protein with LGFP repeats
MVTWMLQGWENGALGYPTSDPFCGLPGGGCGQHFQGGSIYWDGVSDMAVPVPAGPLRDRWAAQGWERGRLGYPTNYPYTYPYTAPGGVGQNFQGGSIRVVNGRVSCTGC